MHVSLRECPACHRHLRAAALRCVFCDADAPAPSARPTPTTRLSRSSMLKFGAAVGATLAVGCGERHEGGTDAGTSPTDGGPGGTDSGTDAGPGSADAGFDAGFDAGEIAMPYGAPPLHDEWV